jgi:hypothetical protein
MKMKTNNWVRSNLTPFREYKAISVDTLTIRKVNRFVLRGIFAGLIGIGCIDHVPTILAISKIILAYINFLIVIMHGMFTTNDVTSAEICTLISNANEQYTAAVERYEQIVSRD